MGVCPFICFTFMVDVRTALETEIGSKKAEFSGRSLCSLTCV